MIQNLNRINLVLIVLIGGLCVFQWQVEKNARANINSLQRTAANHEQKIAEQEENLKGANEDIEHFRVQVTELKAQSDDQVIQIREQKAQVFRLDEAKTQLTKQSESLRQALDAYKAAIASRDENIKTLLEQRDQLYASNKSAVEKANLAIGSYNEINTKYADLVGRYNELAAHVQAAAATNPDETKAKSAQ
jgi:chromosome segregation ATPase